MLSRGEIEEVFKILNKAIPDAKTELKYVNHYTLLVAVVLSAQSTDVSVNKATEQLFKIVSTPKEMLDLGEEKLIIYIKTIGLYKNKAKNIIALSKILEEQYQGDLKADFDFLISLPGVGRKTANVMLNVAFNQPTMAVDTHVFRLSNRIGISNTKNLEVVEQDLLVKIPKKYLLQAHHLLILHGRYICKARNPCCEICKISHICSYFKNNT